MINIWKKSKISIKCIQNAQIFWVFKSFLFSSSSLITGYSFYALYAYYVGENESVN